MAPAEERDEKLFDDLVLADDDLGQLAAEVVERRLEFGDGFRVVRRQVCRISSCSCVNSSLQGKRPGPLPVRPAWDES